MENSFDNGCKCDIADGGYCNRHGITKNAHFVQLCRTKPDYFRAWEENRGPGQVSIKLEGIGHVVPQNATDGPGTELSKILKRIGIRQKGCPCRSRASLMNRNGPAWCRANIEQIVTWMESEAKKRRIAGVVFTRAGAAMLVRLAIRRSERKAKSVMQKQNAEIADGH